MAGGRLYFTLPQILDVYQAKEEAAKAKAEILAAKNELGLVENKHKLITQDLEMVKISSNVYKKKILELQEMMEKSFHIADDEIQRRLRALEIIRDSREKNGGYNALDVEKSINQLHHSRKQLLEVQSYLRQVVTSVSNGMATTK